jgi:predicted SAM-dependent methyltransferase
VSALKQRLGKWLIPRLPVSPWVFGIFRRELNAMTVRLLGRVHPGWIARRRAIGRQRGLLVNIGCGPFGREGWINLDLFAAAHVTMRADCRRRLPLADASARGIHVEHYFEHLEPATERPRFLAECRRCLESGGVLRIIVPDMRKYIDAYIAPGWEAIDAVGCGGEKPQAVFATKMEALNHVFVQDGEHYGGFDAEHLRRTLVQGGFSEVEKVEWRQGRFPGGAIDRDQHKPYSLYMEAIR